MPAVTITACKIAISSNLISFSLCQAADGFGEPKRSCALRVGSNLNPLLVITTPFAPE